MNRAINHGFNKVTNIIDSDSDTMTLCFTNKVWSAPSSNIAVGGGTFLHIIHINTKEQEYHYRDNLHIEEPQPQPQPQCVLDVCARYLYY